MGNGSYYAEIMFVTAGAYDLNVQLNGNDLPLSPITQRI